MSRRYSFESVVDPFTDTTPPPNPPPYQSPPRAHHPDLAFERLRAARRNSREPRGTIESQDRESLVHTATPPRVPPHRDAQGRYWGRELGYAGSMRSDVTPGADNFAEQASGGITGIAMSIADARARQSGLDAVAGLPEYVPPYDAYQTSDTDASRRDRMNNYDQENQEAYDSRHQNQYQYDQGQPYGQFSPYNDQHPDNPAQYSHPLPQSPPRMQYPRPDNRQQDSQSSLVPLVPLSAAAMSSTLNQPYREPVGNAYADSPFKTYGANRHPGLGALDPTTIEDDGDDGLEYNRHNAHSRMSLGQHSHQKGSSSTLPRAAAGTGVMGALGGLVGRPGGGDQQYDAVNRLPADTGYDSFVDQEREKSAWMAKQSKSSNKWKWILGVLAVLVILGAIGGGVAAYFLNRKTNPPAASTGQSAADDAKSNGDLTKDSAEIKALMNNKNLHKVFPGVDYTPINTQYPDCIKNPPSQNNVTRDIAVLSQLTNQIRLYGTDCNQTEMVLHAIDALGLKGTTKVWLGVWQDKNATTNARQLTQMYNILENNDISSFQGAIVGNECIFRNDMTVSELETILTGVKSNFTALGYNLSVSTSDIGAKWTSSLATASDYLMANIHPFFAGVPSSAASAWTVAFWQTSILPLKPDKSHNIIAETGWPSGGGTDCGSDTVKTCPNGSVAAVAGMNQFMGDFVCQALANGTQYFMFEAFDEPWKAMFNTDDEQWEDKWGLMDVNRNLKPGIVIPSCGGQTAV